MGRKHESPQNTHRASSGIGSRPPQSTQHRSQITFRVTYEGIDVGSYGKLNGHAWLSIVLLWSGRPGDLRYGKVWAISHWQKQHKSDLVSENTWGIQSLSWIMWGKWTFQTANHPWSRATPQLRHLGQYLKPGPNAAALHSLLPGHKTIISFILFTITRQPQLNTYGCLAAASVSCMHQWSASDS